MFVFKKTKKTSLASEQKEDLLDDVERRESTHEMVARNIPNSEYMDVNNINSEYMDENDQEQSKKHSYWSWKCLCLTCTLTFTLVIIILMLVLFFNITPKFAQNTLDNANMDIIEGTIYNPTNSSITLNTTIVISNAGFLDGKIDSTKVSVSNNGIIIGTMRMPSLNTKANTNTIVKVSAVLEIVNKTQFQHSCKELLRNIDQTWHITAQNVKLRVDTGVIGKVNYFVNLNKDLILKGTKLYNFIASDFNVASATNYTITTVSNLNFISDSAFTFNLPDTILNVYYNDTYIGYAQIDSLSMKPGLNTIYNQSLIIESYAPSNNRDILGTFFSNYVSGRHQKVIMRGPVSSTVIDGILEETLLALGYMKGNLAIGGLVTSATQQGWTVNDKTIRGAYADFVNPLNVPIQIVNMSGNAILPEPIKYRVVIGLVGYDCDASIFAALSIGEGIYRNNPSQTWIDVAANGKVTYFSIVNPPAGSKPATCDVLYPFSCCFASISAAYACKINPGIQENTYSGELTSDYMPLILKANATLLIDNEFKINLNINQDFFPLYFGWQVYGGYALDLKLSCSDFTFK